MQDETILDRESIRKREGGPKHAIEKCKGLSEAFLRVIERHTAGSPVDEKVKWTNLTHREIAEKLEEEGFEVSVTVVRKLFAQHGFHRRKASKTKTARQCRNRDEQFRKIEWLKGAYDKSGNPSLSMDSKKKNP